MLVGFYDRSATGGAVGTGGGGQTPVILSSATTVQTTTVSSHPITLPSGVTPGDLLLLAFVVTGGGTSVTDPSGWTPVLSQASGSSDVRLRIYKRIATGSDAVTIATASIRSAAACLRISPATTVYFASGSQGSSNAPDCPNLAPGVGAVNFLWLSIFGSFADGLVTGAPSGFGSGVADNSGVASSGASIAVYSLSTTLDSSKDPAAATATGSRTWALATLAVQD